MSKMNPYFRLMRLDKPIGILLLLWPTLWALWLSSNGHPDIYICFVFVMGVILMRSAGCVINDFADRKIDPHVKRTNQRPIASGEVSPEEALILFAILSVIAFMLVLTLNVLTIYMSVVALFLAATYPFMKRYTYLPQVYLGLAFAWAIPMSYTAHNNALPGVEGWLLLLSVILWAVVYDTMYAMVDREDDLKIGVKSTAILFADMDKSIIAGVQITMILIFIMIGEKLSLGLYYYAGVFVAIALSIYQQYLIKDRDTRLCFKAFLNNNWLGAAMFVGIFLNFQLS